jgi:hypothetical protein
LTSDLVPMQENALLRDSQELACQRKHQIASQIAG